MKINYKPFETPNKNFHKGKLYTNEENNSIVLCTETSTQLIGVRIAGTCVGEIPSKEFATYTDRWISEDFIPYKGTVILTEE